MTGKLFNILQIIICGLFIASILLQQRGGGLSSIFGGEDNIYRTKRGFEKGLLWGSVSLAILYLTVSFLRIYLQK